MRCAMVLLAVLVGACRAAPAPSTTDAHPSGVPTYRGDAARTGVMPGPGPAGAPALLWQFQAAGPIQSSAVAVPGTTFVASTDGVVHAVATDDGKERWSHDLGSTVATATPLLAAGLLVVGDADGVLHALDAATGAERWATMTHGPIGGAAAGVGARVLVGTDTGVDALDVATGTPAWESPLPGPVTRSIAATEGLVIAPLDQGRIAAIRTADGQLAWTVQVAPDGQGGTPAMADGRVFIASGLGSLQPNTRVVAALDAATGAERWRYPSPEGEELYAPAIRDGRAYIVGEDAKVVAVESATGKELWVATATAPIDALAAIVGSLVIVATTGGTVEAFDIETGAASWQVDIQGIPYAPIVIDGVVLVATNVGVLYAFG